MIKILKAAFPSQIVMLIENPNFVPACKKTKKNVFYDQIKCGWGLRQRYFGPVEKKNLIT